MYSRITLVGLSLFICSQGVMAQTVGYGLAQANNCFGCHRIDASDGRKRLGPDFPLVAERYQGSAAAVPYLATRIRSGARGVWGAVPMPAQAQLSQADSELLAAWVLSLSGAPDVTAAPVKSDSTGAAGVQPTVDQENRNDSE